MPYLSHNYRYQERSRIKSLFEVFIFVSASTISIFVALFILGWISASAAQAATGINTQLNYQGKLNTSTGIAVSNSSYR